LTFSTICSGLSVRWSLSLPYPPPALYVSSAAESFLKTFRRMTVSPSVFGQSKGL
jgi:hypothetical protein